MIKLDSTFWKLLGLVFAVQVVAVVKTNVSRWLLRSYFPGGVGLRQWFHLSYWMGLGWGQLGTLLVIASFTALTFPIGVMISSHVMSKSFTIMRIATIGSYLLSFPISIYTMAYRMEEFPLNDTTIAGALIMWGAYILAFFGAWVMYSGVD